MKKEYLASLVDNRYQEIMNQARQGNLMFFDGECKHVVKLDDFIRQSADGVLYDLNRLEEVTITLAKNDTKVSMVQRFDNDIAMAVLVRYLLHLVRQNYESKI